jgi:hypothetical protein
LRYTYDVNVGDGVQKDFSFSFAGQDVGYLATSNIAVFVAGTAVSNYTILPSSPNVVNFNVAPPIGAEVLIRRIMPKNVPFSDFSRGNPFSQDTLNKTNLQMLYLIQEIYDGYLPEGFFFRVDIDMRGHKIINLADGVDDGDSVNMRQFKKEVARNDAQDGRLTSLEDNITAGEMANFFAQLYVATGGETTINTTNGLFCAALYIQGLYQHKIAGAYSQNGAVITFAEPLEAGWEVYLILGTELPSDSIYATIESVNQLTAVVSTLNSNFNLLKTQVDSIASNYAKKGANVDITSLGGLTTPLSISQGGTGNTTNNAASADKLTTARGISVNLAASSVVVFDGTQTITIGTTTNALPVTKGGTGAVTAGAGWTALLTGRTVASARTDLGLGTAALKDVGIVANTVAAGDDPRFTTSKPGAYIGIQVITSNQTYVPTTGTTVIEVEMVGGGAQGGGAGASTLGMNAAAGQGGGAGAYIRFRATLASLPNLNAVIGAGGTGAAAGAAGNNGGDTTFAGYTAGGGKGGAAMAAASYGISTIVDNGGVPSGGNIVLARGMRGVAGVVYSSGGSFIQTGRGGASFLYPGGHGNPVTLGAGVAATEPGCGGSGAGSVGTAAAAAGGAGFRGIIIIREYQ